MSARPYTESAMARETAEIPLAAERLLSRSCAFQPIVERIRAAKPRNVILCGRGSSSHVGVYLRYLFEAQLGLLVSHAAPSIVTAYGRRPYGSDALFILVSQSGRSPDLIAATQAARDGGALTLALVNDPDSPAAEASELVLPIDAGPERAVAATKTVVLSMLAGARLVAALAGDREMQNALEAVPYRLRVALDCDWSLWADSAAAATATYVAGRGYALGCALEIALKVAETLRVPALGYSAAEFLHGPRASLSLTTPILFLRQNDRTAPAIDELVRDLSDAGYPAFAVGSQTGTLPWIPDHHPACDPIVMLVPAYVAIEAVARRRGFDPDAPPHLSKVTRTT